MKNMMHPFHLVTYSPWPIISSINLMNLTMNFIFYFYFKNLLPIMLSLILMILCMYNWWMNIIHESTYQGFHPSNVKKMLKMGMLLFIVSEIFFFLSFFWCYFHNLLSPDINVGMSWPPKFIYPFNPYYIPLLNTIILLTSGLTITWSHFCLLNLNFNKFKISIILTIFLGLIFTILQSLEYFSSMFSMNDSIFGSIFFMTTGFHGIHVLIGTIFISINLIRFNFSHFTNKNHFSFEASAWYWHFVDLIWLILYFFYYWWIF